MSYGDGGSDAERRIRNLEDKVYSGEIAAVQKRLAALEQAKWQGGAGPNAGPTLRIMFVTSDVAAMSGTVAGSGTATDATFDPGTGNLVSSGGDDVTVWNYHEKSFLTGGIISAELAFSQWWAFDVNACSKYS